MNGPAILIAKTPAPPMWSPSCRKRPAVPVCWSWCSPPCASTISTCIPLRWASSTRWKASPAKAEVHLHHTGDRDSGHHAVGAGHSGPLCRLPDGAWRSLPADYRHHAGGLLSLRSHRKITDESRRTGQLPNETPTIGWAAIVASIAGGAVGLATEWGVPTINSLVAASLLYWVLKLAFSRAQNRWPHRSRSDFRP